MENEMFRDVDVLDRVAALEKNVMSIIFEATYKLAHLTNCQSFLMFESNRGRRFYTGSQELCRLYSNEELTPKPSDEKLSPNPTTPQSVTLDETPATLEEKSTVDSSTHSENDLGRGSKDDDDDDDEGQPIEASVLKSNSDGVEKLGSSQNLDISDDANDRPYKMVSSTDRKMRSRTKCKICGKRGFGEADLANHHRRFHGDNGPFRCSKCSHGFKSRTSLNRHSASRHDVGTSKYLCNTCGFCTIRKDNMQQHMLRMHYDSPLNFSPVPYHQFQRTCVQGGKWKGAPTAKKAETTQNDSKLPTEEATSTSLRAKSEDSYEIKEELISDPPHLVENSSRMAEANLDIRSGDDADVKPDDVNDISTSLPRKRAKVASPAVKIENIRYQCHLCTNSYSLGHNLGFHLRRKHRVAWRDYLSYRESIGQPLVNSRCGKPKKDSEKLGEARITLNKKMIQQLRSSQPSSSRNQIVAKPDDFDNTSNVGVDVGGFTVKFDRSIKKLICPLCEGLFPCYSSLRKHVSRDHEPNQNLFLCRFGNCRMKFKNRRDASLHLLKIHNSARDDKYLKTLPLHLGDFFKARCAIDNSSLLDDTFAPILIDEDDDRLDCCHDSNDDHAESEVVENDGCKVTASEEKSVKDLLIEENYK